MYYTKHIVPCVLYFVWLKSYHEKNCAKTILNFFTTCKYVWRPVSKSINIMAVLQLLHSYTHTHFACFFRRFCAYCSSMIRWLPPFLWSSITFFPMATCPWLFILDTLLILYVPLPPCLNLKIHSLWFTGFSYVFASFPVQQRFPNNFTYNLHFSSL